MAANYTRNMKQTVTYWAPSDTRDVYGKTTYTTPVQMAARWEQHMEIIRGKGGEEIMSKARVYCAEPVQVDGYLYLGESAASDPTSLRDAQEIKIVGVTPDLRNLTQLNMALVS